MKIKILVGAYIVISIFTITILFLKSSSLSSRNKQLQATIDTANSTGINLLKRNGYNVEQTTVTATIANPGNLPGISTSSIELTVPDNGEAYIKDPGDFDATRPCVDQRERLLKLWGGAAKAPSYGIDVHEKGCAY